MSALLQKLNIRQTYEECYVLCSEVTKHFIFGLFTLIDEATPDSTDQLQEFKYGLQNFTQFSTFLVVSAFSYGDQVDAHEH